MPLILVTIALSESIILLNSVDFPTLTGPRSIILQTVFSFFVFFAFCNILLHLLKNIDDFFIIFLKLNSSSSTKSIDAVISANKLTISSLNNDSPLTLSPLKSNFLLYSRDEKLSFAIIWLIAFACFREFFPFKTDL